MKQFTHPEPGSRVIVFTEIEQFGGAERSALALARWLHQQGLPVHVLCYEDRANLASYADPPLPVVQLKASGTRSRIAALGAYLESRPQDAPRPLLSGYQPALHATLAGVRAFHDLMHDTPSLFRDPADHSLQTKLRLAFSNRIVGRGLRSGGVTIVTSEYLRQQCRNDFGIDAQIARMGGLAGSPFRIRPVEPGAPLRVLSVCRIEQNKRIDWILNALAQLERQSPPLSARADWQLDLAGKGPLLEPLAALANNLGLGNRVRFLGFVPDNELEVLYNGAHLFLMPAVQGYGIPAIEALQRGIPVLLHRESGVSDILLDTPWATVLQGGAESLPATLQNAVDSVLQGTHHTAQRPQIPTEDQWAERVARLCGWLP